MSNQLLWTKPVILKGGTVRLEPMTTAHVPDLAIAGKDKSIWKYMIYGDLSIAENMSAWVVEILRRQSTGSEMAFIIVLRESRRVVGATRYMEMHPSHRSLEIGGTWISPEYHHSGVNTECKYLLLKYAF